MRIGPTATIGDLPAPASSLTIDSSGNVGIGTTTPATELDVIGTVSATLFVGDGSGLTGISEGDPSYGSSAASPDGAVFVDDAGFVGVGTPAPLAMLDVDGQTRTAGLEITGSTAGPLVGWGRDNFGQITVPPGTFTAVAAGYEHSLAIRSGGTLAGWGRDNSGQIVVPPGTFTAVAAGFAHSLAISTDGTLEGWGLNDDGQTVVPPGTFTAVAAGNKYSLAISTDGTLVGWGLDDYGQSTVPPGTFTAVAAGRYHSLAIEETVYSETALIVSDGNVGIGVTSPATKLEVDGTVTATSFVGDGSGLTGIIEGDPSYGSSTSSPDDAVYVDDDGEVGIGTTTPGADLTVRAIAGGGSRAFKVEEADGTMTFAVREDGNAGVRQSFNNVDFNIRNKSGNTMVFGCEKSDGTNIFHVWAEGNVGIGASHADVALNVMGESGDDSIFNCEHPDGTDNFKVDVDGEIWAHNLRYAGGAPNGLGMSSAGEIVKVGSSRRYKENIEPFADDFDLILQTELKQWTGKRDDSGRIGFGFIADEIEELGLESLVVYDQDGQVQSLKFRNIPLYTLEVVKRHEREVKTLQAENEELRDENKEIRERLAKLEELVERLAAK